MTLVVSVVVPTYQHVAFISQCLDSILSQKTNFDFEIILGEDESKDGTREICLQYAEKYPEKIRLFLRSRKDVIFTNGNATGRYNFIECLKAAKGKYVALCEGDDYWTDPLKLQKQVDLLESNDNIRFVYHNADVLYDPPVENKLYGDVYYEQCDSKMVSLIDLFGNTYIKTCTAIFRNTPDLLQPFIENRLILRDTTLFIRLLENTGVGYYLNETMAVYRVNPNSGWALKSDDEKATRTIIEWNNIKEYFKHNRQLYKLADNLISVTFMSLSYIYLFQGKFILSLKTFFKLLLKFNFSIFSQKSFWIYPLVFIKKLIF